MCDPCVSDGLLLVEPWCVNCDSSCQKCIGTAATQCMSCYPGKYLLSSNSSCVSCNVDGYFVSGSQCLQCNSTCKSCNDGATSCTSCYEGFYLLIANSSCTPCNNTLGYYANDTDQTCHSKTTVQIIKFELQEPPQLYLLSFDTPLDLENSLMEIKLYQILDSSNNTLSTDMSEVSFALTKLTPSSYQLNFLSYTESNEDRSLWLSFDLFNLNSKTPFMISPTNSTAPIFNDSAVAQAAAVVGSTSQAVFISTAISAVLAYLQSKGASTQLMRILQVMARINFMKVVNVNYLTPLNVFYNYTDLGQFGLPNVFNTLPNPNNSQVDHQLISTIDDGLFMTDSQGNIIFNDYFKYSFSKVFLDNYGGIVFSTCVSLTLCIFATFASKCFKNENSAIKKMLTILAHSFKRGVIITLLVARYEYLCSSLIHNYAFTQTNGVYQQISFAFAILYTILLGFILILTICVSFYHRRNKVKLKPIRPLFGLITFLCQEYRSKTYLGRIMTYLTLQSNLIIMLVLELLRKWTIAQLSILITLNIMITIVLSLPKKVFKTAATKIIVIGTEIGFIIISVLFLAMYLLESSGSYQVRLGLSWTAVVVNIAIILFHIVVRIVEFFRVRRAKKFEEQKQKQKQAQKDALSEDSRIHLRNDRELGNLSSVTSARYGIQPKKIRMKVAV